MSSHLSTSAKHPLVEYLDNLPSIHFSKLYHEPAACLYIFRCLSSLSQYIILKLLFVSFSVPFATIKSWFHEKVGSASSQSQINLCMWRLKQWQLLQGKENMVWLNPSFQSSYMSLIGESSKMKGFLSLCTTTDQFGASNDFLQAYGQESFEKLLQFLVGNSFNLSVRPNDRLLQLLLHCRLMTSSIPLSFSSSLKSHPSQSSLTQFNITQEGFQFLLQNENNQLWTLLIQYIQLATSEDYYNENLDPIESLSLLFQLSFSRSAQDYDCKRFTKGQLALLNDLKEIGLVYMRKVDEIRYIVPIFVEFKCRMNMDLIHAFYATFLCSHLSMDGFIGVDADRIRDRDSSNLEKKGYLIIETNYHVYAYTHSALQIAILGLFLEWKCRFPNFVIGSLTRDSVQSALKNGISADQIITYLEDHDRPVMIQTGIDVETSKGEFQGSSSVEKGKEDELVGKRGFILPATLVDQIKLWEMELHRLTVQECTLYSQFLDQRTFEKVVKYANEIQALTLEIPNKRMLAVSTDAHPLIKAFIKNL